MEISNRTIRNLFLQQSYEDMWENYKKNTSDPEGVTWDYLILTASDEKQASIYREQIYERLAHHYLSDHTHYAILPDPNGKRIGSGGATFQALRYIAERTKEGYKTFQESRVLIIHSGGDSKRIPQYSAVGKIFAPIPRELPDGRLSTLFDEIMICMESLVMRIPKGMVILSGDVLFLFNPQQIDFQFTGAAAICTKENVERGVNHGVFLKNKENQVDLFLHKQKKEILLSKGVVDQQGYVYLDTGVVLFDCNLIEALYSCVCSDNVLDEEKYNTFVSENVRLNVYEDFLYPLSMKASLETYLKQQSEEGDVVDLLSLKMCRRRLWEILNPFSMHMFCPFPAEFIHFGTTWEVLKLHVKEVDKYSFLKWKLQIGTSGDGERRYAAYNSLIDGKARIKAGSYIENSCVMGEVTIGQACILSNLIFLDKTVPDGVVLHGLPLKRGGYVVRTYGINDNPKALLEQGGRLFGATLQEFVTRNGLALEELWDGTVHSLWEAKLYPICETMGEAVEQALFLLRMFDGTASVTEIKKWCCLERMSLSSSFLETDMDQICDWSKKLEEQIKIEKFVDMLIGECDYKTALSVFEPNGICTSVYHQIMEKAICVEERIKLRIYYAVSQFMKWNKQTFEGSNYHVLESQCFDLVGKNILKENQSRGNEAEKNYQIQKERADVFLPLRVNWGGGWTDTPPYCVERGGTVLNAAVKLKGNAPVHVIVRRLDILHFEFVCADSGISKNVEKIDEIFDCKNVFDAFAIHKSCLIACEIVTKDDRELKDVLQDLGGGMQISIQVLDVPRGSGLGTSSILMAGCVKGIFEILGIELSNEEICRKVLSAEQIMGTGGGWQDPIGSLIPGVKYCVSDPGQRQDLKVSQIKMKKATCRELQERFALIYTGQRRLARNILREVMGHYIGAQSTSMQALEQIQRLTVLMKFELERGNVDDFAELLSEHWEVSKKLDCGITNTCIEQIFLSCTDLLTGRMITGAGGGGFLQVILKKGKSKKELAARLRETFQDSGSLLWDCELMWE